MKEWILMSTKERERMKVLASLCEGLLNRRIAAQQLKVSDRQLRRLINAYKKAGDQGLISKLRCRKSNNRLPFTVKEQAVALIRLNYLDFGPTLAHEKLTEVHKLKISKSSVRSLMIEHKIWHHRKWKQPKIHKQRERRECYGELGQMDGSYHDWFEGRGPKCCLLVLIDDATSKIGMLKFVEWESVFNYFESLKEYINNFGLPLSLYTDRHAVFETTRKAEKDYNDTQFHRAMKELGIELILARSPQAKGRVERVNGILQDRLIKEMRLVGISSIEEANLFVTNFIKTYNQKFAKKPKSSINAHRVLEEHYDLDRILCLHHDRKITKDLMVYWGGKRYQITDSNCQHRLSGKKVKVLEKENGYIELIYKENNLEFINFDEKEYDNKIIQSVNWRKSRGGHPSTRHPWKKWDPHPQNYEKFIDLPRS